MRRLQLAAVRPGRDLRGPARAARGHRRQPQALVAVLLGHAGGAGRRARPSASSISAASRRGDERLVTWEATLPRRGRHRLAGVRVTTRFPFGLFLKAGRPALRRRGARVPGGAPGPAQRCGGSARAGAPWPPGGGGGATTSTTSATTAPGDDPRLIHWRSSAKTAALTVREMEAETTPDTRIVLVGRRRPRRRSARGGAVRGGLAGRRICSARAPGWSWPAAASAVPPGPRAARTCAAC